MQTVISISLGSSTRDFDQVILVNDVQLRVIRKGTDGDLSLAAKLIRDYDGKIPFIGLGGANIYYHWGNFKYACPQGIKLASLANKSVVVDGSTIKKVFDRQAFSLLQSITDLKNKKVLIVSALDRPHLIEFCKHGNCSYIIGDAIFALKLPVPFYSHSLFGAAVRLTMPLLRHIPLQYLYPTGCKQVKPKPGYLSKFINFADIICGDFHMFRRLMPPNLDNKIILASTITSQDIALVQERGASALITASPLFFGRALGANLWEALLFNYNKALLSEKEVETIVKNLNISPEIIKF